MGEVTLVQGYCPLCHARVGVRLFSSNRPYAKVRCQDCGVWFEFRSEDKLPLLKIKQQPIEAQLQDLEKKEEIEPPHDIQLLKPLRR